MKFNKWTVGLATVGVISLASAARADEQMSQVQTALSSTTLSGYVDTAATWRPGTDYVPRRGLGGTATLPAYSFAKNDGFSLNAIDIALDRPMDESPWAAGYHVELMWGPNAVPASTGTGGPGALTSNIRQAYLALRTPIANSGIDWKIGVWDTIIGYESTSSPLDPNYTRSYGYSIEPTTHTGILATYRVNDMVSVSAGLADSSNVGTSIAAINGTAAFESQKTYMGAVALTAPDSWGWIKGATLSAGVINAVDSHSHFGANRDTTTSWYAGATIPTPLNALKAGMSYDYLALHNGGGEAWVLGLYGTYQVNDKLSFNLRGEYGQDDTGLLYGNFTTQAGRFYARNSFEELTATASYQLWANVLSRLEFRWDHVEHGNAFGANSAGATYRGNDFLIAANLIYQF